MVSMQFHRYEDQLIIKCLRSFLAQMHSGHIEPHLDREVEEREVDGAYLLKTAEMHRVTPMIYLALRSARGAPEDVLELFREEFDRNALYSLALTGELLRVLERLQGIPVIPFKGPLLAALAYGNINYRQFDDLDVLIEKKDYPRARDILHASSYREVESYSQDREEALMGSYHHRHFYNSQLEVHLEVHWQVAPKLYSFGMDVKDLFKRAKPIVFSGREVLTLSPEDAILLLSEHGTRHYWSRLSWVCDIAKAADSYDIDWPLAAERARDLGCRRILLLSMLLSNRLLEAPLPEWACDEAESDIKVNSLIADVERRLFAAPETSLFPDPNLELFYLRARERMIDKARYYFHRATTPTSEDWEAVSLSGPLFPLYHLIRPARLMSRYRSRIWEWLR